MENSSRVIRAPERMLLGLVCCLAFWLVSSRASAEPAVKRFALVVGATRSPVEGAPPLQFSDDDAVNLTEVLQAAGVATELLVQPDEETIQLHPGVNFLHIAAPTNSNVVSALRQLAARAAAAKRESPGSRVEVFFGFSGHGSASSLVLHDPKSLTGDALRTLLLDPTRVAGVDAVHLLVDACGVVSDSEVRSFADALKLGENPHTGLFLALTDEGQALEWDVIGSGVFSYELRSALLSAADLAGDRNAVATGNAEPNNSVEYREVGAFVSSANDGVKDASAHMYPAQSPPGGNLDAPLLAWDPTSHAFTQLLFPPQQEFWVRVSDATVQAHVAGKLPRHLLLAELHLGPRQQKPTVLRLPRRARYHVQIVDPRGGRGEVREFEPARDGDSADISKLPLLAGTRGGLAEALKDGLFRSAYDERSIGGYNPVAIPGHPELRYIGRKGPPLPPPHDPSGPWPEVLCIATGVAASFTAVARVASNSSYSSWQHAKNEADYDRLQSQTSRWDLLTTVGLGATAAAGAGCAGTLLHAWVVKPAPVAAGAGGVGASLRLRF